MSGYHRSTHRRRRAAALALTSASSMLVLGVQAGPVSAAPADPGSSKITATPRAGAAQTELSPAKRTALLKSATANAGDTADQLGLGSRELTGHPAPGTRQNGARGAGVGVKPGTRVP
ncbi:hypothetical protein ACWD4T_48700, partial [Streptomyces umbrinus]